MDDHTFCRAYLKRIMVDVRKHVDPDQIKSSWAYKYSYGNGTCEFHGPNDFYIPLTADCLWEAKAKGWVQYLESIKAPGYEIEEIA